MNKIDLLPGGNASTGEIPYENVILPSRGLLYPDSHPLHNEATVEIRPMKATDENILVSVGLLQSGKAVNRLLSSCLINKAIDVSSLILGDKVAISLAVRRSGFGNDYRIKTKCPSCGKPFSHTFDLSKLDVKYLDENPIEPGLNLFETVLPVCKKKVQFSIMTVADEDEIIQTVQNRKKAIDKLRREDASSEEEVDTMITDRLIKQIKSVDGVTDAARIASFVENIGSLDARPLRELIFELSPDIYMEDDVKCPHCKAEETHNIPITTEFFWPKLGSRQQQKSRSSRSRR